MLSYIQHKILASLMKVDSARYSELIPEDTSKDLFNYHLRFLVDKGYIKKDKQLYSLSNFGKKYVQRLDVKGNLKDYFKVSVLPFVLRTSEKKREILLHERGRHPYMGDISSNSGKLNQGELIEDAASRILKAETGLKCEDFKLIGVVRSMRYDSDERLIEDTFYHVCLGEDPDGVLKEENEYGKNYWSSTEGLISIISKNKAFSENDVKILQKILFGDHSEFFYLQEKISIGEESL